MAVQARDQGTGLGVWAGCKRGAASLWAGLRQVYAGLSARMSAFNARFVTTPLYRFLTYGPLIRLIARSLVRRIIFANLIGLVILIGGIVYLSRNHVWLIDAKRESLRAQGEIIAAAIAANASLDSDRRIVLDPDRLPEIEGSKRPLRDDAFAALQLSIAPERVTPILQRLVPGTETRARVYARDGTLIVDTDQLLLRRQRVEGSRDKNGELKVRSQWTRFLTWLMRGEVQVYRDVGAANGMDAYPEVRIAMNSGTTANMLLINDKYEQIVSMAVPIQYRKAVQGVLLLSSRPGEIDDILQEERNVILALALTALATTLLASWLLARTIAGPMRRLSEAAEAVSGNISARSELPRLTDRADEVGQMTTAFHKMTASLYRRIEASERFAQDVAHELKNPLTAARSTAEALAYAKTPEMQRELVGQIQAELSRLNKLISDVANASMLDADLARQQTEPVDMRRLIPGIASIFEDRLSEDTRRVEVKMEAGAASPSAFVVSGHEARLGRVITNLLDNAISFSPEHGVVSVSMRRIGSEVEIVVEDEGPGIPPDKLDDVFKRFYSDRPQTDRTVGKNSGLGLSITRDIIIAYGGRVWASNRQAPPGAAAVGREELPELRDRRMPGIAGARFTVRLPAWDATAGKGVPPVGRRN
ncbi:MAG: stimulus-sensing domain-containing protein [Hyphomicrobiaceae bacterium]|nr:stimulus-sensing domain-containing protein [Hyphomicrobiaceae bacterium]